MASSNSRFLNSRHLLMEGKRLASLANDGKDPINNLYKAIALWKEAIQGFEKGSHDYAACLSNEAGARAALADLGQEPKKNLEISLVLHLRARREGLRENTVSYAINLMSEGNARLRLAIIGVEPERNLRTAIELYKLSRKKGLEANTVDYSKSLMNEGTAKMMLAESGFDPAENFRDAILLFEESRRQGLNDKSVQYANTLINEGTARRKLASLGTDSTSNLSQAIILFQQVRNIYLPNTTTYAMTFINEGNARASIAKLGVSPKINLDAAIDLYQKTRNIDLIKNTVLYARSLANEGTARIDLAKLGFDTKINLLKAIALFEEAREEGITENTTECALTYLNEGEARKELGKIGVEREKNFEKAELNFGQAIDFFLKANNKQYLLYSYSNFGDLKYFEQKYPDAYIFLKNAIELIESLRTSMKIPELRKNYLETVAMIYRMMVFTCLSLDKLEEAFHYAESIKGRMFLDLIGSGSKSIKGPSNLVKDYYENLKQIEKIEMSFVGKNMPPDIEMALRILKTKHEKLLLSIKEYDSSYYGVQTAETISINDLKEILKGKTLLEYFVGEKIVAFVINNNLNVRIIDESGKEITKRVFELRKLLDEVPNAQDGLLDEMLTYLYNLLIKPVRDLLGKTIVIVPHGVLHLLPFQALKGNKYIIDDFTISFAQSASSLKYLRSSRSEGVLIVGNPTEDLDYSEKEAIKIAEYFNVKPILGLKAKKEKIIGNIGAKRILHFACHGKFDQSNPNFSGIVLNDGMLTTVDFMNMILDAELVALSACETAKAGITSGDEIEGLVRAIHYSGSRFVIASLWSVADESTFRLFVDFYKSPGDFADRLRLAEMNLKNQGSSVYNWAPFQIYGI